MVVHCIDIVVDVVIDDIACFIDDRDPVVGIIQLIDELQSVLVDAVSDDLRFSVQDFQLRVRKTPVHFIHDEKRRYQQDQHRNGKNALENLPSHRFLLSDNNRSHAS